jgi:hypothetical protein
MSHLLAATLRAKRSVAEQSKLDELEVRYREARILHARIEEIQRSLQCACRSRYGYKQLKATMRRLRSLLIGGHK